MTWSEHRIDPDENGVVTTGSDSYRYDVPGYTYAVRWEPEEPETPPPEVRAS